MTDFIKKFLTILENENIRYVHWKSNTNIEKALAGIDDLDILVDKSDKYRIFQIFRKLNIIRGYSEKDSWQHEIYHYFGMDLDQKKLIHIHLHFQLDVGYDFDKNVYLPVSQAYLEEFEKYKYIRIASVENEYIVLIIRLLLKNGLIPFLLLRPSSQYKLYKNQKKGIVKGSAYQEFIDLNNRVDREKLEKTLKKNFPFLPLPFFYECEDVIKQNNSLKDFFSYSKKLKNLKDLKVYHGEVKSFLISFYRINSARLKKIFGLENTSKKIPEFGGKIFAFVGGDGAGKTTNIEKLKKTLEKHFYTQTIHIGRPKLGLSSYLLLIISKALKTIGMKEEREALIYLAIAISRKKAFLKAQKLKKKGFIVLLDRIPLNGITSMDCPRIHTLKKNKLKFLIPIEQKIYSSISNVDKLIVLKLDPEIALKRRPEDDPNQLKIRSGQIWEKDFSEYPNAHILDTSNSVDYVEKQILNVAWESLNNRPLIFEMLGLAGTGKTTLKKSLEKIDNKYRFDLNTTKAEITLLKHAFLYFEIYIRTKNLKLVKALIAYHMFLKKIKEGKYDSNTIFIFDHGPVFIISNLIFDVSALEKKFVDELDNMMFFYNKIFYLYASPDILIARINQREQEHRIKNIHYKTQILFLEKYDEIFKKIINHYKSYGMPVVEINTEKLDINTTKNILLDEISMVNK